jgi:hypothetical protein
MARREPLDASKGTAEPAAVGLSDVDLEELLGQARVPTAKRAACANDIRELLDWYNSRIAANKNELNEARQAESYAQIAEAAQTLLTLLSRLPQGARLAVEPDYRTFVERAHARRLAEAAAYDVATKELTKRDPDDAEAQEMAGEVASLLSAEKWRRCEYSSFPNQLPLELILAALIEKAEDCRWETEERVDRNWSKERGTYAKNQLALNLKAIIMGYSPTLHNDQAGAEDWAAVALEALGFSYPDPEKRPADFRKLFDPDQPVTWSPERL